MKIKFPTSRSLFFGGTLSCLLALPLSVHAEENAADLTKVKPVGAKAWDEKTMLETAEARIQQIRTGPAEILVLGRDGKALANTEVRVRLVSHEFKLGCNAFGLSSVTRPAIDPVLQRKYEDRFAALLNYATLPFY